MHATSISITNFRRFEQFDAAFDRHFTLLMGANGSGKTSALAALHAGISTVFSTLGITVSCNISEEDVRRKRGLDPSDESWRTPIYPCRIKLTGNFGNDVHQIAQERTPTGLQFYAEDDIHSSQTNFMLAGAASATYFDPSNTHPVALFARYGATGAIQKVSPSPVRKPFSTKQEIWERFENSEANASGLSQWFQYNELRTLQEGQAPLIYRKVKEAVLSAIHAEDLRYIVRDDQLMLLHEGQGWRPFDQLSDGQRRIAALFCDLALRCASLNSQLGEDCIVRTPGIVTIDELDLHLHPSWQREVVGDLRRVFPELQFIVTSHSPFLLQAAFEHGQVVDMRTGQFVQPSDPSIEDITESVMGVAQPQRGQRFLALKDAAQRYLELLESPTPSPEAVANLKAELDTAMAPFANDPASAAWLEQRRTAKGL